MSEHGFAVAVCKHGYPFIALTWWIPNEKRTLRETIYIYLYRDLLSKNDDHSYHLV